MMVLENRSCSWTKLKTYDVNYIDEEQVYFHDDAAEEVDDELLIATLAEEGD